MSNRAYLWRGHQHEEKASEYLSKVWESKTSYIICQVTRHRNYGDQSTDYYRGGYYAYSRDFMAALEVDIISVDNLRRSSWFNKTSQGKWNNWRSEKSSKWRYSTKMD